MKSLKPALCDFSVELSKKIQKKIYTITEEFLAFKKSLYPDWQNSVLNCLDFHYSSNTLKIIEANTNSSGYLVTHLLSQSIEEALKYEKSIYQSFLDVFDSKKPEPLFIIDENPKKEKMYPEFLMFKDFFKRQGLDHVYIVKTSELPLDKNSFVYNRDTDFHFDKNPNLLKAFNDGSIKLSTSPLTYDRLASKKNDLSNVDTKVFPNLNHALLKSLSFSNSSSNSNSLILILILILILTLILVLTPTLILVLL